MRASSRPPCGEAACVLSANRTRPLGNTSLRPWMKPRWCLCQRGNRNGRLERRKDSSLRFCATSAQTLVNPSRRVAPPPRASQASSVPQTLSASPNVMAGLWSRQTTAGLATRH